MFDVRDKRIELLSTAWKAVILPLNQSRYRVLSNFGIIIANYMRLFNTRHLLIAGLVTTCFLATIPSYHALEAATQPNVFTKKVKPLKLYPEVGSKKIKNIIFKPTVKKTEIALPKSDTSSLKLDDYTLNIFCTETTKTYIKAVSGSAVFLSDPRENTGLILTNAHVARHLLDGSKKCVGRTGSPAVTTQKLTLRYIPSFWLNSNNQYIIGDPDQNSTGEFDFALIETELINPKKTSASLYDIFKQNLKLRLDGYNRTPFVGGTYIYSYPAGQTLSKNIYNPLLRKKDAVSVGEIYASPLYGDASSLLDVNGSSQIDHGSSGGMVVSVDNQNSLIGLSSILIKNNQPQVVRVVTLRHVFSTLEKDLLRINNAQTDSFLKLIQDILKKQDDDTGFGSILKNIKLTSVLEKNTRDTLIHMGIILK